MARGVRKPIEQKIEEKQELIKALETRIKKEKYEFKALLRQKREEDLQILASYLSEDNLSPQEATELIRNNTGA